MKIKLLLKSHLSPDRIIGEGTERQEVGSVSHPWHMPLFLALLVPPARGAPCWGSLVQHQGHREKPRLFLRAAPMLRRVHLHLRSLAPAMHLGASLKLPMIQKTITTFTEHQGQSATRSWGVASVRV